MPFLYKIIETISLVTCIFILVGGILISLKTRFIQFRAIPKILKLLFCKTPTKKKSTSKTISAKKALFTAMSTSIGIGNVVSPIIAIKLGGPGALLGFVLAMIFGSASTFTEVAFALKYRKKKLDGTIFGGPMQYIKRVLSPSFAKLYAYAGTITLTIWAANQSNALSDLLGAYNVPGSLTGLVIAIMIIYVLTGGIKRVSKLSAKLVPVMLVLYTAATLWIIFKNIEKLPSVIDLIFRSAFSGKALFGAGAGYGIQSALRWGLAKGYFSNVSGTGISTIPHSMSSTTKPIDQGILAMASVYTDGFLCLLSGFTVLLTGSWLDPSLGIGINIIAKSFTMYFSSIGTMIIALSTFLFSFGTMVGEGYIGSQCFSYIANKKFLVWYNILIGIVVFIGAVSNVSLIAKITDIFLLPLALPNIISIIILSFKRDRFLKLRQSNIENQKLVTQLELNN